MTADTAQARGRRRPSQSPKQLWILTSRTTMSFTLSFLHIMIADH